MVVVGCYGAVLSKLLFLDVNSVPITFCIQCIATEYILSSFTVICLYNIIRLL